MSEYIVSARKYRPATFDNVVGQSALTTTLKNAIATGKLAHAYLFCGPRGVGKTTSARIFAKTINCLNPGPNGEACNECESCRAFNEQRSYNIHELDAASNNSVDDIRELIEQVQVPPQVGRYKVFIIDEVHMLSPSAFNAFLKTLEEPPAHAIFILATTEKHKILPTILSRCQIYDFNRMEVPDIVNHLKKVATNEGYTYEEEALGVIARKADGGMRDALSIFDQVASFSQGNITYAKVIENLNVLDYDYYFDITDSILKCDIPKVMVTLNEILSRGFEGNHFIGGLASHLRDLLVSRDAQTLPLLEVADSVRQRYQEQAQRCTPKFLYAALRLCNDCDINYRASRNKRLLVEITLIEVAQLTKADDDAVSGGRRPIKRLLPIFAPAPAKAAAAKSTPTVPHVAPQTTTATATIAATAAPTTPASTAATATTPTFTSKTTTTGTGRVGTSFTAFDRLRPISIRTAPTPTPGGAAATTAATPGQTATALPHPAEELPATSAAQSIPQTAPTARPQQMRPLDEDSLRLQWMTFASMLPVDLAAEAGRLKIIAPVIREDNRVEATVENQLAAQYLNRILPQLTNHLRTTLQNDFITVSFPVDETRTVHHAYSPREILSEMVGKNPAFAQLVKALDLQPT